jgi:hypothetical protein
VGQAAPAMRRISWGDLIPIAAPDVVSNAAKQENAMTSPGPVPIYSSCELCRTANYVEELSLRTIMALPRHVELVVTSRLLTAKDPQQSRVRHRSVVAIDALVRLRETLAELLPASGDGTG